MSLIYGKAQSGDFDRLNELFSFFIFYMWKGVDKYY